MSIGNNELAEKNAISLRRGTSYHKLAEEMERLYYREARFHPCRWYTLPSKYKGMYVITDEDGWRIDRSSVSDDVQKALFFGGSAMFSTTTRNEGTIPSLVQKHFDSERVNLVALNYGMGGYSTYAEIGAFSEALRREKNVRLAVFYDGVNETAMYIEMLQYGNKFSYLGAGGWPFMSATMVGVRNFYAETYGVWQGLLDVLEKLSSFVRKRHGLVSMGLQLAESELFNHAERIANNYLHNVRVLQAMGQAFGVKCIFVWQPDIFTTRKRLTEREKKILEVSPVILRELASKVYRIVMYKKKAFENILIVDGTRWLNSIEGDHFFDFCHVSEEANEVVARELAELTMKFLAAASS